jgi:hypothetical protein
VRKTPPERGFSVVYFFFFAAFFFTGFFLAAIGFTPSGIDNKRMSSVLQADREKPPPERLPALI